MPGRGIEDNRAAAMRAVQRLGGPRLRFVAVGGAVVPPSLLSFLKECFGNGGTGGGRAIVSNGYAMAEVLGVIARDGPNPNPNWRSLVG